MVRQERTWAGSTDPALGTDLTAVSELEADFLGGAHRREHAGDNLRRAGAARVVAGFGLHQLGVREDDAELIVEPMEEQAERRRFIHRSVLLWIDRERQAIHLNGDSSRCFRMLLVLG